MCADASTSQPMRELVKTEDPSGSVVTIDEPCDSQPTPGVRLWSKDFDYLGTWCSEHNRFEHSRVDHGVASAAG